MTEAENGHMKPQLERFKPAAGKRVLLLISGLLWIGVGSMLLGFAYRWLAKEGWTAALVPAGSGFILSLVIHHFGFLRVVDKNLGRILPMEGKKCVFAFQSWKSYAIIAVMAGLGIALRHSPIPKNYLSVLYIGIGFGLILSSIRYLRFASVRA